MIHNRIGFWGLFCVFGGLPASADVVITFRPHETGTRPVAEGVAPGTTVLMDVLVAADGPDVPLSDVRLLQFDFSATTGGLELGEFTWLVPARGYGYRSEPQESYPVAGAASLQFESDPSLVVLTAEPVCVATVQVTVNASGKLSVLGEDNAQSRTRVDAGFGPGVQYSLAAGTLKGGTYEFHMLAPQTFDSAVDTDGDGIPDSQDPDDDNDGVADAQDAFPLDASEAADTDGDGIGDNAEGTVQPDQRIRRRRCGAAAMGTVLTTLIFLGLLSNRRLLPFSRAKR